MGNPEEFLSVLAACTIQVDFSRQDIKPPQYQALLKQAQQKEVERFIHAMVHGEFINFSENRQVLHMALRMPYTEVVHRCGRSIADKIHGALDNVAAICQKFETGKWQGDTAKSIKNIITIGMGGSILGPIMAIEALKSFQKNKLEFFFIPDGDPHTFEDVTRKLQPEESLFIIISKSMSTAETLLNAAKAKEWGRFNRFAKNHFIAITANPARAMEMGFEQVLPIWEWIGGRFSFCSAVNLPLALHIGFDQFKKLLSGAYDMDSHFLNAERQKNIPLNMALIGICNVNDRNIHNQFILISNSKLKYFVPFLQQLEMESNGKSINRKGERIEYHTCPIINGGIANQIQHSYYQLLCQGTHRHTVDFLVDNACERSLVNQLIENQIKILSAGDRTNDIRHIAGNIPISVIRIPEVTPYILGALVALYENKVAVQGYLWDINSFDQYGVESAKKIPESNNLLT